MQLTMVSMYSALGELKRFRNLRDRVQPWPRVFGERMKEQSLYDSEEDQCQSLEERLAS